jgi:hypothetical protein
MSTGEGEARGSGETRAQDGNPNPFPSRSPGERIATGRTDTVLRGDDANAGACASESTSAHPLRWGDAQPYDRGTRGRGPRLNPMAGDTAYRACHACPVARTGSAVTTTRTRTGIDRARMFLQSTAAVGMLSDLHITPPESRQREGGDAVNVKKPTETEMRCQHETRFPKSPVKCQTRSRDPLDSRLLYGKGGPTALTSLHPPGAIPPLGPRSWLQPLLRVRCMGGRSRSHPLGGDLFMGGRWF